MLTEGPQLFCMPAPAVFKQGSNPEMALPCVLIKLLSECAGNKAVTKASIGWFSMAPRLHLHRNCSTKDMGASKDR